MSFFPLLISYAMATDFLLAIAESVEGLEGGTVIYKMKAIVERGRFANNMIKKKVCSVSTKVPQIPFL